MSDSKQFIKRCPKMTLFDQLPYLTIQFLSPGQTDSQVDASLQATCESVWPGSVWKENGELLERRARFSNRRKGIARVKKC